MNPSSENAARLTLLQQAASLANDGLDPLGSATVSMRWARPAADGLLLVPVSACAAAQACLPAASSREAGAAAAPRGASAGQAGLDFAFNGIPFFHPMVALSGRPQIACCPAGVYAVLAGSAPAACTPADELAEAFADDPFGEYGVEPAGSPAACIASAQQMILQALGGGNACLVAHYGLLTVGPNPRAAVSLARQLEALCRIYWQALQVGGVRVMPIRTR